VTALLLGEEGRQARPDIAPRGLSGLNGAAASTDIGLRGTEAARHAADGVPYAGIAERDLRAYGKLCAVNRALIAAAYLHDGHT
jgi:hypothetical protein